MRGFVSFGFFVMLATIVLPTSAHARPDVRTMTCSGAQQFVQKHGSVVFTTGQYTFSKFVSNLYYCDRGQALFRQYAKTKDAPKCFVGYGCQQPTRPIFPSKGWD